jgi:hypothetical protein
MDKIWTIEINKNEDFANSWAYHIDKFKNTSMTNLKYVCEKSNKSDHWVVVGLANSLEEAKEKTSKLHMYLCEMHNKKPYGISYLFNEENEEKEELMKIKLEK